MTRFFADRNRTIAAFATIFIAILESASIADDAQQINASERADAIRLDRLESRLDSVEAAFLRDRQDAQDGNIFTNIGEIIKPLAAPLSVLVAALALVWQRKARNADRESNERIRRDERELNRQFKAIETATWCIDRFYDIHEVHKQKNVMYYNRLWGLHYAQFNHYKNRLLNRKLYGTWLVQLLRAYKTDENHREQWNRVKEMHVDDEVFVKFIDGILACESSDEVRTKLAQVRQIPARQFRLVP